MNAGESPKQVAARLNRQLARAIEAKDETAVEEVTNDMLALAIGTLAAQQSNGPQPPKSPEEIQAYLKELATREPPEDERSK